MGARKSVPARTCTVPSGKLVSPAQSMRAEVLGALRNTLLLDLLELIIEFATTFEGRVTTVFGGSYDTSEPQHLKHPFGLCVVLDDSGCCDSIVATSTYTHEYKRWKNATGKAELFAGSGRSAISHGHRSVASFVYPSACVLDPIRPQSFYLSDLKSIRHCDEKGHVTLVAGTTKGYADGVREQAMLYDVCGLLITRDGSTMWFVEMTNCRLRWIHLATGLVTTAAGSGKSETTDGFGLAAAMWGPRQLVFERGTKQAIENPESVIYIAAYDSIRRYVIETNKLTTVPTIEPDPSHLLNPYGIDCTGTGVLIISSRNHDMLFSVDPRTGKAEVVAGDFTLGEGMRDGSHKEAKFFRPSGLTIVDAEQCLYMADCDNGLVRRVTLAPHYFPGPGFRPPE